MVIVGATLVVAHCLIRCPAFAQLQDDGQPCPPECVTDSMEIVTWYPSPYNEYEELRLYPKTNAEESQCNSTEQLGLIYYNKEVQALKVCWQDPSNNNYSWKDIALGQGGYWGLSGNDIYNTNSGNIGIGTTTPSYKLDIQGGGNINAAGGLCIGGACKASWQEVTSATSFNKLSNISIVSGVSYAKVNVNGIDYAMPYYEYSQTLVNGAHSAAGCSGSGGTTVSYGGTYFCKFNQGACPSGWTQYNNYSATQAVTCSANPGTSCTTGWHNFADIASSSESCSYSASGYCYGKQSPINDWCFPTCKYTQSCCQSNGEHCNWNPVSQSPTCISNIVAIGCY